MSSTSPLQPRSFLLGLATSVLVLASFFVGAVADRIFVIKPLDAVVKRTAGQFSLTPTTVPDNEAKLSELLGSESQSVADISDKVSSSVVTVTIKKQQRIMQQLPFFFNFGFGGPPSVDSGETEEIKQDIGSGFVVEGGLVVTNKHVVSDLSADYLVVDKEDKEHVVTKLYRDPVNDLAILKVEDLSAPGMVLGDSDKLRVGESVIAIGTALGEFRHTVTTGVISGLGRGIEAMGGFTEVEKLENVIQTDAAINPGNSGGPLLNARGEVIGVNTAVSQGAQNIGFAIPINVIKASIENFNQTGQFDRPFLGVQYAVISRQAALANEVPQGLYIQDVVSDSPADVAGIKADDILVSFDGQSLKDHDLVTLINKKKVGDEVTLEYWRDGETKEVKVVLKSSQ